MTPAQFAALKKGDVVRHKLSSQAMTVEENQGEHGCWLIRHSRATNPDEWLLIGDDGYPLPEANAAGEGA
ncbi:hypothetical protein [uncultured Paracoccus sp.]|uniref:hypothetical protein n=1 Tax=uncultured Paracoccus sp. TaxID=189685 RepID=UPI0025D0E931|nr:hypothetical protein [uncultured Paracoccus sp.]